MAQNVACHSQQFSDELEVQSGIGQSCILPPMLFFLVIYVLFGGHGTFQWTVSSFLRHFDEAYDICLLCKSSAWTSDSGFGKEEKSK